MMINLISVEEPLRNAFEIIGRYCKHNDCKTCDLKINDDTCITDKDPDVWWMYLNAYRNDEPQTETTKGLQLFADILFDKNKANQFLEECKAIGIEP